MSVLGQNRTHALQQLYITAKTKKHPRPHITKS
jgi:hypothetical protein